VRGIAPAAVSALLILSSASGWCGPAAAQAASGPAASLANPLAGQSLESLSATRERPLFAPTRRPPAPPPSPPPPMVMASPPPAPPEPPALSFYGVVVEDQGAHALVRGPSNESLRLRVGDSVGEWTVKEIDRRRLVLSLGGRSETFSLFDKKRERQARGQAAPVRHRVQTAPNTGHLYEGRIIPTRPSQPSKDEPEL
jgi:hypothetical protein